MAAHSSTRSRRPPPHRVTLSAAAAVKAISCSGNVQYAGSSHGNRPVSRWPSISQFVHSCSVGGAPQSAGPK